MDDADDIYIDADGRRRLGRELDKATPPARPEIPAILRESSLWPPPGSLAAAHRPECGRDGRGCVCGPPLAKVLRFPGGGR